MRIRSGGGAELVGVETEQGVLSSVRGSAGVGSGWVAQELATFDGWGWVGHGGAAGAVREWAAEAASWGSGAADAAIIPARCASGAPLVWLCLRLCARSFVARLTAGVVRLLLSTEDCGLTGTKLGCGEGGCGACTVTLCEWDAKKAVPVYKSVNACLAPLYSVVGAHVVTVEGIGSTRSGLHPVQEKLACAHGKHILSGA